MGRTSRPVVPIPVFPGSIPGGFPAVVGIRRSGEKVLRGRGVVRFYPRPWSAGPTAQRPGAEGLPSQLRYHAKAEVAAV